MRTSALLLLSATVALAASHDGMAKHRRSNCKTTKRGNGWKLETFAKGQDFLNLFNFEAGNHNGGVANYVSAADAWNQGLVGINGDGTVDLRVSTSTAPSGSRNSIKLVSKATHSRGLFLLDIEHQPAVCGAWPAVWMTSLTQQWPAGGEVDIVEYVGEMTQNAFSVHTTPGCWAGGNGYSASKMLLSNQALNCDALATDSQGCGFRSAQTNSAGPGANAVGGGVYAVSIADDGVKGWFFPRDQIPGDIYAQDPNPWAWGTPSMFISPDSCNPSTYFQDLGMVINTNLGGTWPEGTWHTSASYAGQDQSCAQITGFNSAADYVLNNGAAFGNAFWRFRSMAVYKQ